MKEQTLFTDEELARVEIAEESISLSAPETTLRLI